MNTKHIPCGLVARIRRSHRRGRGSIPRTGGILRFSNLNDNFLHILSLMLGHSFLRLAKNDRLTQISF